MKQIVFFLSLVFMLAIFMGCATKPRHHEADLPDPKLFEANFYDIDTNGDGKITSQEFEDYFPPADPKVFETLDLDGDQVVDRDEWRKFAEAHAAKTKQRQPRRRNSGY
jgi:Ca2+-binding EF-hand superfamily protein